MTQCRTTPAKKYSSFHHKSRRIEDQFQTSHVGGGSSVHIYVSVLSDAVKDTLRCFEHIPYFCECFESSIYLLVQ